MLFFGFGAYCYFYLLHLTVKAQTSNVNTDIALIESSFDGGFFKIGKKYGTDKVTHHGYHRYYPLFIERFRNLSADFGMVEIGIDNSYSLKTWLEYFPKPYIYGIDIKLSQKGDRYTISGLDQSKADQLQNYAKSSVSHKIFFVIDDGSHIPEHQILTFDIFFRDLLLPGGVYIIEDIETSYWKRNGLYGYQTRYGINNKNSAIESFKPLIDIINNEFISAQDLEALESSLGSKFSKETLNLIQSVFFGQNCVIIVKKTVEEIENFKKRMYRFSNNI